MIFIFSPLKTGFLRAQILSNRHWHSVVSNYYQQFELEFISVYHKSSKQIRNDSFQDSKSQFTQAKDSTSSLEVEGTKEFLLRLLFLRRLDLCARIAASDWCRRMQPKANQTTKSTTTRLEPIINCSFWLIRSAVLEIWTRCFSWSSWVIYLYTIEKATCSSVMGWFTRAMQA